MLAGSGRGLIGTALGLVAAGVLLPLPGATLAGVVLVLLVVGRLEALRAGLAPHAPPWGLHASVHVDRDMADHDVAARTHRVGATVPLYLRLQAPLAAAGTVVRTRRWWSSAGLAVTEPGTPRLDLGRDGAGTRLVAVPHNAAVHHLVGVEVQLEDALGLIAAVAFLPCPCELAVLPRSLPLDLKSVAETRRRSPRTQGGQRADRAPGSGDDLRELRDHVAGDPFKHIAWKASAARGRLMSRAFERDQTRALYAVVDTGADMRDGRPGQGPLDQALDLVHSLAEACARAHDPFGLALVDGRVVDRRPVLEGLASLRDVDRALLDLRRAVAEDLAPMDDGELLDSVACYLEAVERAQFPPRGPSAKERSEWRQRVVMAALARLPERERVPLLRGPEPSARPEFAILRRFCRSVDLALPYRHALQAPTRAAGLTAGIDAALASRKGPFAIVVLSDFKRLGAACGPLWQACGRARAAGHRVLAVAVREADEQDVHELVKHADDFDTARGLMRADVAARAQSLEDLATGARAKGTAFLCDPEPAEFVALWRHGA
ncbi:MAG: DUF58 domain-containing protein [Myxococcales bacterium]|nr:DUF58 domain-containing protein [Myxococcales bacterium]